MLYMVTWIPSIYPLYVSIYAIHGSYLSGDAGMLFKVEDPVTLDGGKTFLGVVQQYMTQAPQPGRAVVKLGIDPARMVRTMGKINLIFFAPKIVVKSWVRMKYIMEMAIEWRSSELRRPQVARSNDSDDDKDWGNYPKIGEHFSLSEWILLLV